MKKLITIILSALACACMALGFAACGGGDTPPSTSTPQDSSSVNGGDSAVIPDNSEGVSQPPEDSEDIHTHSYELKMDDTYHWTECTCGVATEKFAHDYAKKSDDTHHWTECTCGAILEKTEHSFGEWQRAEDYHFKSCACGKEAQEEHNYNDRNLCTVCGVQKGTDGLEYTLYKENGEYYYMVKSVGFAIHEPTIYIPSFFNGKKVKAIAAMAFQGETWLNNNYAAKSIVLNDEITQIGNLAFSAATLSTLVIPKSVTYIGEGAFGFSNLGILVNQSSIEIKHETHNDDNGVPEETIITNDISKVVWEKGYVFYYHEECYSLMGYEGTETDLVLPENVNGNPYVIANKAFYKNETLTSIIIPDSVTTIGSSAFYRCSSLTGVYITDITAWCAIDFGAIINHEYSNPLYYAEKLYLNNQLVTDLVIPDGATEIKNYAFYWCDSLTTVTIGNGVTSIGDEAFFVCDSLTSVTIPDNVTSIGIYAFSYCDSLTSITVSENNPNYSSQDGILYNKEKTEFIYIPKKISGEITIPDGVTSIHYGAFRYCDSLTTVTIGNGVTSIGDEAFAYCDSLTSIAYEGTMAEWKAISKRSDWNYGTGEYTVYCTDGTLSKSES